MSVSDKAEELGGRLKEAAGDLLGDNKLKAEGQADQGVAKVKQAVDDLAGKAKDTVEGVKEKLSTKIQGEPSDQDQQPDQGQQPGAQ